MKILILGGTGLLGNALLKILSNKYETIGTSREKQNNKFQYISVENLLDEKNLINLLKNVKPNIVINCISLKNAGSSPYKDLEAVYVLLPKLLTKLSSKFGFRIIHISTDAVFSGKNGNYSEKDIPDPIDDYGKSKLIGEPVHDNCSVIRTSMIGHSMNREVGLLDWFIKQKKCTLYKNAIFSGLPVNELSRIISKYFINNEHMNGIFHVSANAISKYDLLSTVKVIYDLNMIIIKDEDYKINRSLNSTKFQNHSGYRIKSWSDMIMKMREESY